jgi:hypothetical protein
MRARFALVPLAVAAAILGGCATKAPVTAVTPTVTTPASNGVADLPVDQILTKAKAALKNAKSFHAKGTTTEEGTPTKVDFTFAGGNAGGTIETEGVTIEIIAIGTDLYMKAPDAFWTQMIKDPAALALLKGKYVKLDGTKPEFAAFKKLTDTDELLTPEGTPSKGEPKTINGVPTIGLIDSKDKSVIYIATQGEPLPIRGEGPGATDVIEFTEYDSAAAIKAPDAANVFDLKTVTG